jgi:hypothetical protein
MAPRALVGHLAGNADAAADLERRVADVLDLLAGPALEAASRAAR